ncbi:hypothetical protein HMPREF9374_1761 [Desmospora sp. 8437]|nr:hypothetical protein HMPREF9374_1761 [Desmospora sp. 8437]
MGVRITLPQHTQSDVNGPLFFFGLFLVRGGFFENLLKCIKCGSGS